MPARFAYVVLSHSRPAQVRRLVRVLTEGGTEAAVVCSHDPRGPRLEGPELDHPRVAVVEDRPPAGWGGFSIVERTVEAAALAVSRFEPDWITVLSGQDFPIRPLTESEAELDGGGADLYTRSEPVGYVRPGTPGWRRHNEVARRYLLHHVALPGTSTWGRAMPDQALSPRATAPLDGAAAGDVPRSDTAGAVAAADPGALAVAVDRLRRVVDLRRGPAGARYRLGVARLQRGVPGGRTLYKGSYWCTMRRGIVEQLAALPVTDPALVRWFRSSVIPDEAFVQTVVGNDPRWRVFGDNFRFVRWSPGSPHPEVLTVADLPLMEASAAHFARKFDEEVDAEVLDRLERRVLGGS